MPSPLTSPADRTVRPVSSPAVTSVILKPLAPFKVERSVLTAKPEALPNTTKAAPPIVPTTMSSKPSPLMSPAEETDWPV